MVVDKEKVEESLRDRAERNLQIAAQACMPRKPVLT